MGLHRFKAPPVARRLKDPLKRQIAEEFARRIVRLRLDARLSRLVVVQRTGINWKKLCALEEGVMLARLDDVVKLAIAYRVDASKLLSAALSGRWEAPVRQPASCLCSRLGSDGRAALRKVARKLA